METKYKEYIISDLNTGDLFFKNAPEFKETLIKAIVEDVRVLADFGNYEAMGIVLTKLDFIIMDINDRELSDMIIHIASQYEYEI